MTGKSFKPPRKASRRQPTHEDGRRLRRSRNRQIRRYARTQCSEDTHFAANRMLFEGKIKNLSAGGTYIQSKGRFIIGQDVVVAGPFAEDRSEVKRRGKIVRLDSQGFAVSFLL